MHALMTPVLLWIARLDALVYARTTGLLVIIASPWAKSQKKANRRNCASMVVHRKSPWQSLEG
jgi:hypothetical protein